MKYLLRPLRTAVRYTGNPGNETEFVSDPTDALSLVYLRHPHRITLPFAQIQHGDAGVVTPPDSIRAVAGSRPAATQSVLKGAGHALHIEQPRAFSRIVSAFIDGKAL